MPGSQELFRSKPSETHYQTSGSSASGERHEFRTQLGPPELHSVDVDEFAVHLNQAGIELECGLKPFLRERGPGCAATRSDRRAAAPGRPCSARPEREPDIPVPYRLLCARSRAGAEKPVERRRLRDRSSRFRAASTLSNRPAERSCSACCQSKSRLFPSVRICRKPQ